MVTQYTLTIEEKTVLNLNSSMLLAQVDKYWIIQTQISWVCIIQSQSPNNGILKNSCCNIPFQTMVDLMDEDLDLDLDEDYNDIFVRGTPRTEISF